MSRKYGDARLPSLRDKINSIEENIKEQVKEKTVKVTVEKGRSKVQVKKL